MHLNRVDVVEGQELKKGDLLGAVGNTGASSGCHLHYQINAPDERGAVDPAPSMTKNYSPALRNGK